MLLMKCRFIFILFSMIYLLSAFFSTLSAEVEWIPTKERTLVGTLTSFFFTFGQLVLAGLAYWLRDWRKLQVVVCVPHFLFFAYSWSVETFENQLLIYSANVKDQVSFPCFVTGQVVCRVSAVVGSEPSV